MSFSLRNLTACRRATVGNDATTSTSKTSLITTKKRKSVTWASKLVSVKNAQPRLTPEPVSLEEASIREGCIENRKILCSYESPVSDFDEETWKTNFESILRREKLIVRESVVVACLRRANGEIEVEFINADMASRSLCLNGYPLQQQHQQDDKGNNLMNRMLLYRPFEYVGTTKVYHTSWDEYCQWVAKQKQEDFTKTEHARRVVSIQRFPEELTAEDIRDTLWKHMETNSLMVREGNPIVSCRKQQTSSRTCAFAVFRTQEEATAAQQLSGTDIGLGTPLKISGAKVDRKSTTESSSSTKLMDVNSKKRKKDDAAGCVDTQIQVHNLREAIRMTLNENTKLRARIDQTNKDRESSLEQLGIKRAEVVHLGKQVERTTKRLKESEVAKKKEDIIHKKALKAMEEKLFTTRKDLEDVQEELTKSKIQFTQLPKPTLRRVSLPDNECDPESSDGPIQAGRDENLKGVKIGDSVKMSVLPDPDILKSSNETQEFKLQICNDDDVGYWYI